MSLHSMATFMAGEPALQRQMTPAREEVDVDLEIQVFKLQYIFKFFLVHTPMPSSFPLQRCCSPGFNETTPDSSAPTSRSAS